MGDPPPAAMTRPSLILPPGTILGGYEIEEVLGIGGMAVVYRAVQRSLGRPVALKVLNPRLAADETFRARFRREGAMVAALDHPSVVPVHDLGEVDGRLFLAMRLIEGVTLADRLDEGGVTADELRRVLRAVANALDAAHVAGVLHRDIKPQNVLLADDGLAYLADFGVARTASSDLTRTREFFGSVSYVAPEQIRGEPVSPAADIYGLAVMAFECLTGSVPFRRDTDAGVIHAHLELPPPPIGALNDPAAAALSRAVAAGLEKQPEDRPSTAGGFVDAVELAIADLPHEARVRRPAFPVPAADDLPLPGVGGAHPPRGGTQPIAVQPEPESAPAPAPEPAPAVAPARDRSATAPAPAPAPQVPRPRRRWRGLAAAGVVLTLAVLLVGAFLLPARSPSTAEADVPRLAASGVPERVTRAAREAREQALARERAAERRAAEARAAARRRAAAKRKAQAERAASSGSAAGGASSGASAGSAVSGGSSASAPAPSGSSGGGSSGSSGGSSSSSPSSGVCDFPPC